MTGGRTLGPPLNWSWMHKPSVFLAVCQCERGGGSCRSGPGLNDGARNLCFRSAMALWALTRAAQCAGIRRKMLCLSAGAGTDVKMNAQNDRKREKKSERSEVDRRDAVRVTEESKGVRLVRALCRWMRNWGIVCKPICSSVGEVVGSSSQGWGPGEKKVRAASRAAVWRHEKGGEAGGGEGGVGWGGSRNKSAENCQFI